MSKADQCPSTVHEGPKHKPSKQELSRERRSLLSSVSGKVAWRSSDEIADTPQFRDFLEREFPAGITELFTGSRRTFMKVMGASVALAGAATLPGCRRPDHKILTYSATPPEDIIPGKPLFYATTLPLPRGGVEGVLVETHEGRPTKIEGNPLHPINRGKSSVLAQASVLSLYDPDRLKSPVYFNRKRNNGAGERVLATWDDFVKWGKDYFPRFDKSQGAGLAIIVDKKSSPTRDAIKALLLKKWPKATWVAYDSTESVHAANGGKAAFGAPMHDLIDFSKAKVVLSLDRNFLDSNAEPRGLVHARDFASTRRVEDPTAAEMSRLYVIESGLSLTGGQADHRLRAAPSKVVALACELAKFMLPKLGAGADAVVAALPSATISDSERKFIEECAKDLMDGAKKGATIVVAGEHLPAGVHAAVHAINQALATTLVKFAPMSEELASDSRAAMATLTADLKAGKYDTVICVGTNPAYDAPDAKAFADAFAKLEGSIALSVGQSETAAAATWALNGTHFLESWGDALAVDGTISPIQPMIAPLYAAIDAAGNPTGQAPMSDIELLAFVAGDRRPDGTVRDGFELVRATWKSRLNAKTDADFDKAWKRALHDGLVAGTTGAGATPKVNLAGVAAAVKDIKLDAAPAGQLEAVVRAGWMHDGRFSNITWLQELPQFGTSVTWDNPALLSPKTAADLGLLPASATLEEPNTMYTKEKYPAGRVAEFEFAGRKVTCACWILPGVADGVVILTPGYGRTSGGLACDGVGFDIGSLRGDAGSVLSGVKVTATADYHAIASTQNHWSLEGRTAIVRAVDLQTYTKFAGEAMKDNDEIYAGIAAGSLNFAEKLGELSHTPPNVSSYDNPYNRSAADLNPNDPNYNKIPARGHKLNSKTAQPPNFAIGPQWGMTIDLSTCTGCGACTIACQAENNIPVVGKKEVAKGRELHWIRVDRYFAGDYYNYKDSASINYNEPEYIFHQPVACVHCENAPCEVVCPVNATVHGNEGHNYMVYNRCIGTRYCANNCPYKVRRYNFFEYGLHKFNGDYVGKDLIESIVPDRGGISGSGTHNKINPNLIPPRLREKLDEIERMQKNPDVTVRMRGVMEKCSYCIQRTNAAKVETRLQDLNHVPDGFVQSACQQACPSDSIIFGDILDTTSEYKDAGGTRKGSRVHNARLSRRSYLLLGYLNTRPRTSHLLKVSNPNPALVTNEHRRKAWEHPFHDGGSHGGDGHGEGGHGTNKEHAFFDERRKREDKGYALSLGVLSSAAGLSAGSAIGGGLA